MSFFFRKVSLNYILVFVLFYCAGFLFWEFVYIESVFFVFICIFFFFLITLWWFYLFIALGPHLQHVEVPRLRVKSELQLLVYTTATATWDPSHTCDLHYSSWQRWILTPLSKAKDQTCILMDISQICFCWATRATADFWSFSSLSLEPLSIVTFLSCVYFRLYLFIYLFIFAI